MNLGRLQSARESPLFASFIFRMPLWCPPVWGVGVGRGISIRDRSVWEYFIETSLAVDSFFRPFVLSLFFLFLPTTFTHTHTHDPRPLPTTHDPRHLATLTKTIHEMQRLFTPLSDKQSATPLTDFLSSGSYLPEFIRFYNPPGDLGMIYCLLSQLFNSLHSFFI